jgi:hypothetical protein
MFQISFEGTIKMILKIGGGGGGFILYVYFLQNRIVAPNQEK